MRGFVVSGIVAVVMATGTPAAAQALLYESTPISSADVFDGVYYGGQAGGATSGEFVVGGILGYNFASLFDSNVIFGVQGTLGLRMPAHTVEVWAKAKLGAAVGDNLWAYGIGGVGYAAYGGYQLGGGVEWAAYPDLWLSAELVGRGEFGSAPADYALYLNASRPFFSKTNPYDPSSEYLGDETTPRLMWGFTVSTLTSFSKAIGGPEGRLLFPLGNGVTAGPRASFNVAVPGGSPEIFGGGQLGYDVADNINVYAFADVGRAAPDYMNAVGVGATYGLDWHWHVLGEAFTRGPIGTLTETGAKVGIFYRVAPPEGY